MLGRLEVLHQAEQFELPALVEVLGVVDDECADPAAVGEEILVEGFHVSGEGALGGIEAELARDGFEERETRPAWNRRSDDGGVVARRVGRHSGHEFSKQRRLAGSVVTENDGDAVPLIDAGPKAV